MKNLSLLFFFMSCSLLSSAATDYDYVVDGIYYKISEYNQYLEVAPHPDNGYTGDIVIPSQLDIPEYPREIKAIGEKAFYKSAVTSVTLPESVWKIEYKAFALSNVKSISYSSRVDIGEYAFYECKNLKEITLNGNNFGGYSFSGCANLEKVEFTSDAKISIPNGMFRDCSRLKYIDFNNIIGFGQHSFANCVSIQSADLKNVTRGIGDYAFEGCTGLKSINLSEDCMYLGSSAFKGCSGLTRISIPNIQSIGYSTFTNCDNLKEVEWNVDRLSDDHSLFQSGVTHKSSIETFIFGPGCESIYLMLNNFDKLRKIVVGENVTYCATSVCVNCPNLSQIEWNATECRDLEHRGFPSCNSESIELKLGENVKRIPSFLFRDLNILSIRIPSSVKIIGKSAFEGCKKLKALYLPNEMDQICESAFSSVGIEKLNIPYGIKRIDNSAFLSSSIKTVTYNAKQCQLAKYALPTSGVENVYIGNDVTRIPDYAFYQAKNLRYVSFGLNVSEIGSYAFYNTHIEELRLMQSISRIEDSAFSYCPFKKLTLDSNVKYIGKFAFGECRNLNDITCYSLNPPEIFEDTFKPIGSDPKFSVPMSAYDRYMVHPVWKKLLGNGAFIDAPQTEDPYISFVNGKIQTNIDLEESIQLYNLLGQLVYAGTINHFSQINLASNSIYILKYKNKSIKIHL